MATKKITEFTTIVGANVATTDLLEIVDVSDTTLAPTGTNKKLTVAELFQFFVAATTNLPTSGTLSFAASTMTLHGGTARPRLGVTREISSTDYKWQATVDSTGRFELFSQVGAGTTLVPFIVATNATDNTLRLGSTGIGVYCDPAYPLDVLGQLLNVSSSRTNAADKAGTIVSSHYTIAEEPIAVAGGSATSINNLVLIGGGFSAANAATQILFYCAADTTTTMGSVVATMNLTSFTFADGVKVIVDPSATTAGFNLGLASSDPSTLANGDVWLNSTSEEVKFRVGGATKSVLSSLAADALRMENVGLAVSVASSAITIALKQADGSTDATAAAPVKIGFASATATSGAAIVRSVTGSLSMTVSNGSSLGFAASTAQRVWVGAIDNSGTVELCCWTSLNSTTLSLLRLTDGQIVSTTAEGGAGGADSSQTLYSTTARSNVPLRVLGYFDITPGASFAWTNSPSLVRVSQPGSVRTGDAIQIVATSTGSVATGTTQIPLDDTIPQNTEGTEFQSLAITPTSALSLLEIVHTADYASSAATHVSVALFQDSTANALLGKSFTTSGTNDTVGLELQHLMRAGTTSATTMKVRVGGHGASTITFNGFASGRKFGGVNLARMKITEVSQ